VPEPATQLLDASAFLAYLGNESGADSVADAIANGATIATLNLAEALSTLAARGKDPAAVARDLIERGLLHGAIAVEPFTTADAIDAARLRPLTSSAGLSVTDRSCLAVARRLSAVVLTADHAWDGLGLDVDVRVIRSTAT
jgi:PIN domain nuclease of toxin-antitoxin system